MCRNNFSFKCHRKDQSKDQSLVYAVNDIAFHPVHGTFSTCGAYLSYCASRVFQTLIGCGRLGRDDQLLG